MVSVNIAREENGHVVQLQTAARFRLKCMDTIRVPCLVTVTHLVAMMGAKLNM